MRLHSLALFTVILLISCAAGFATTVSLLPDVVPTSTNREYNLTLNNLGFYDTLLNISLRSDNFIITQGFGGQDWNVQVLNGSRVHWDNSSLGSDVVHAVFPFRATSPKVNETSYFNMTLTLYGNNSIQRLHREIRVDPLASRKEVFSLEKTTYKKGSTHSFIFELLENVSSASFFFLGEQQNITVSDTSYSFTKDIGGGEKVGQRKISIKGEQDGKSFEQVISIDIIPNLELEITAPATINTSSPFIVTGQLNVLDSTTFNETAISIFWDDTEQRKKIDTDNHFVTAMVGPTEPGIYTLIVQFELGKYIYETKKEISVKDITTANDAEALPVEKEPVNDSDTTDKVAEAETSTKEELQPVSAEKGKIKDVSTGRSSVNEIDYTTSSSSSRSKVDVRPVIFVIMLIVIVILVALAIRTMNFQVFSKKKEEELEEEEQKGGIDWDTYFEKRRPKDEEQ